MDKLNLPALELIREQPTLDTLLQFIDAERELARRPLFVLGAGISAGEVPFLKEMAAHLALKIQEELRGKDLDDTARKSLSDLNSFGVRISEGKALRSDAAEFFFTLQGSASAKIKDRVKEVWEEFSGDLLSGNKIKRDEPQSRKVVYYKPIQEVTPTECHRLIAAELIEQRAWCISFNFDRLTAQAVHHESASRKGCAVLHTQEQVDSYFAAPLHHEVLPTVFKVRGDVFYASCSHPGCSLLQSPVPLHSFLRAEKSIRDRPKSQLLDRNVKLCPECGMGSLVLQLSFPGLRAKEEEAFPLLRKIASYIHHRISAIIIVGLSGHWDDYVLEFLCDIAIRGNVPIVDVKPDVNGPNNPISEFVRLHTRKPIYVPLAMRADDFAKEWKAWVMSQVRGHAVAIASKDNEGFVQSDILKQDRTWFRGDSEKVSLSLDGGTSVMLHEFRRRIENLIPTSIMRRLSSSAQLAIDNIVLAGNPGEHNRWHHSMGAAAVGLLWFRRLAKSLGISDDDLEERTRREVILATALILHDYGHLPFSHLAEQIIDEINWTSDVHDRFGSEFNVLQRRLFGERRDSKVDAFLQRLEERAQIRSGAGAPLLLRLIGGLHAEPWESAILNSPIDADKIDYVFRDVYELSNASNRFPFQTRLPHNCPETWLTEFLADQYVNQHGILCFGGRSAVALLTLLEERMFLYRRLYRAPELRLAERMASEFVRQFLIQGVWREVVEDPLLLKGIGSEYDLRELKNELLQRLLEEEYERVGVYEGREWPLLERIHDEVLAFPADSGYRDLLSQVWTHLEEMREERSLSHLRSKLQQGLLVGSPFYFSRDHFAKLRQLIRPLQHQYCCDVLFDLVSLPKFLSGPKPLRLNMWNVSTPVEPINILVPKGPAEEWNFRSAPQVPLSLDLFRRKQDDICMVYIFDPSAGNNPQAYYALDKFLAACKRDGLDYSVEIER